MKVTVCQMRNQTEEFAEDWLGLVAHTKSEDPDVVLLPEMPFYPWLAFSNDVSIEKWHQSMKSHEQWQDRLSELQAETVLSTRPIVQNGRRLNQGFVWQQGAETMPAHIKRYLPEEPGFWEASWYEPGEMEFEPVNACGTLIGFSICTELWFMRHARDYGQKGIHLLACPRCTSVGSLDKWLAGGRSASVISGAFGISSNRAGSNGQSGAFDGGGWIIHPEAGEILGVTTAADPFLTLDIDLDDANRAKDTYPRYVKE